MENRLIYTIGYGKREIHELIAALESRRIRYLIDVRSSPYSRFKPEFSREALEVSLRRRGIRYVFMGDQLGGRPSDATCYVDGKVDYDCLKETAQFKSGIKRLRTAWDKSLTICLMCSEGRPEECHRSKLIGMVLQSMGIEVAHIDFDGKLRNQESVIDALTDGQMHLFEPSLTSRKRYKVDSET